MKKCLLKLCNLEEIQRVYMLIDPEMYFQEIENKGNLEEFLDRFMSQKEFLEPITEYLNGKY